MLLYSFEEDDEDIPTYGECKYCGESGLHWEEFDTRWKLCHSNGKVHKCQGTAAPKFTLDSLTIKGETK